MCTCVQARVEDRGQCWVSSSMVLYLIVFGDGVSLNLAVMNLARLAGQKARRTLQLLLPQHLGSQARAVTPSFLHEYWGSNRASYFSSPFIFLVL